MRPTAANVAGHRPVVDGQMPPGQCQSFQFRSIPENSDEGDHRPFAHACKRPKPRTWLWSGMPSMCRPSSRPFVRKTWTTCSAKPSAATRTSGNSTQFEAATSNCNREHRLPVVSACMHLGGVVTSTATPVPELYFRFLVCRGDGPSPITACALQLATVDSVDPSNFAALWRNLCKRASADTQHHPWPLPRPAQAFSSGYFQLP